MLLVAIGAVLGHVCLMPFHAHAGDTAAATEDRGAHDDGDDRAAYRASCEALRTTPAELPSVAVMAAALPSPLPLFVRQGSSVRAPVFRAELPPLFLLHAAFLI